MQTVWTMPRTRGRVVRVGVSLVGATLLSTFAGIIETTPLGVGLYAQEIPTQDSLPVDPRDPIPGSDLHVWLITAGPGDAVWERFGHNAIRLLDTGSGRDVSFNWGIFDFNQVDFIPRFLKGEMLYMMAPFSTQAMLESYAQANREVVMQELALTPQQKLHLRDLAVVNAMPENRDYFYDYFLDNCSTRARDLLDEVLGGVLETQFSFQDTGTSYRTHNQRLTQIDPLVFTGMDILLGTPGDKPITTWEEMYIPMTLRDAVREVSVIGADGRGGPLVLSEQVVVPSTREPEPDAAAGWFLRYLLLGVLGGGVLAFAGMREKLGGNAPRAVVGWLGTAWSLLCGLGGLILVLVLFTDHWSMRWNENLFLLNPLSLALVVLTPMALMRRGQAHRHARLVAFGVVAIGVVGLAVQLLPISAQGNGMHFAFFLPVHIGLAFALHSVSSDEVAA